jgi:hypothetical protein
LSLIFITFAIATINRKEVVQSINQNKLQGMFWDLSPAAKKKAVENIVKDPVAAFHDEQILLKALNSLCWYELIQLTGSENLYQLLDDKIIGKLFPQGRRTYYTHAKRLLSKYTLSGSR